MPKASINGRAVIVACFLLSLCLMVSAQDYPAGGPEDEGFWGKVVWLERQQVAAGSGQVVLELRLPEGYKANYLAPLRVVWWNKGDKTMVAREHASRSIATPVFPLSLAFPARFIEGDDVLTAELTIYYCREGAEALCLIDRVRLQLPFIIANEGGRSLRLAYQAPEVEAW